MAHPALLLAFANPGPGVTDEEYSDWCDNEHIPLRLKIPAFTSWSRWKAADGKAPNWAALYDITSYADTQQPPYSTLGETRSEREKRILRDVEFVERRVYEQLEAPIPPPSVLFDERKPARFVNIVSIDVKPGSEGLLDRWYDEEHTAMIAAIPGWVRSRRFVLNEWSRSGLQGEADQQPAPRYLVVHEWDSVDAALDPATGESFNTPLMAELKKVTTARQIRVFEYHKHWERE